MCDGVGDRVAITVANVTDGDADKHVVCDTEREDDRECESVVEPHVLCDGDGAALVEREPKTERVADGHAVKDGEDDGDGGAEKVVEAHAEAERLVSAAADADTEE